MFKSYASKITSFLIENKEINQDDYEVYKYGFEVLNIGKPNEYTYHAKIEKYHFGYVLAGGLNPIAAIKKEGIPTDVKSIETMKNFNSFEEF